MKHYNLKTLQLTKAGFTDLFILETADFVPNATTAHVLTPLALGDVVMRCLMETKTYIFGPATATVSMGVAGGATQFSAASDVKANASKFVAAVASVTPYPTNTAVNLIANAVVGVGALTAGEVWIWANINRATDRDIGAV